MMKRLQWFDRLSAGISLAGALLFGWQCYVYESITFLAALGALVFLLSFVICFTTVRCPFCGHYWGLAVSPRRPFCPWCGADASEN